MIRIIVSEIQKIDAILNKAFDDMDINFGIEPKDFDNEILKCSKLMAFRLSKEFEGAIFNVQYKGNKKFDVYIKSPFAAGVYNYNTVANTMPKVEKTEKFFGFT